MAVKNRTLIGGGILLAVLGTFLSFMGGLFPGLGGGGGTGDSGDGPKVQLGVDSETPETKPPSETAANLNDGVLDVLIDGKEYLVLQEGGAREAMTLEKIGQLAKQAPGNEDGFRVRISQKDNAAFSAEQDLKTELEKQGLRPEQIRLITEPVE